MARVELPQSKIRARKRRMRIRIAMVFAFLFIIIVGTLSVLSRASFWRVSTIAVSGNKSLSTTDIQSLVQQDISGSYLFLFPKDNILIYPRASIAAQLLKKHPVLKAADVHAGDFHTISVTVAERQPAALWCATNCYLMDEDGLVYTSGDASSTVFVTYSGTIKDFALPSQFLTPDKFHALAAFVAALSETQGAGAVRQVAIDSNGDARAYFQDNFLLIFSLNDAAGDLYQRFTLALQSDPLKGHQLSDMEYIDLRFGDKLYYKLKGE